MDSELEADGLDGCKFFGSGNRLRFDEKIDHEHGESQTIRCQSHFCLKV